MTFVMTVEYDGGMTRDEAEEAAALVQAPTEAQVEELRTMARPSLTEFLLARIAEDEALLAVPMSKRMIGRRVVEVPITRLPDYMARDRARWTRECEAKRSIVAEHPATIDWCETCIADWLWGEAQQEPYPCPTLRQLAAVYADHPDYRAEWAL